MKLGVLQFFSWPERRGDLATVYARALERIEIMDRAGYHAVWLAEHHFTSFSVCPSVLVMGTHAAARTKRLRIGTGVTLAAFYHPLRLAEELALLDVLSGGRLLWGAGRGFDRKEFEAFGVPAEESAARFRETVEVVLAAWANDRLTFHGEFFDFEDVEVLPKPAQRPAPPTWIAATSEPAVRWAAERGHSILMDPHSTHAQIAEKQALYAEVLRASGHSLEGRDTPVARLVAIGKTAGEAREIARRGATWITDSYANPTSAPVLQGEPAMQFLREDRVERYLDGIVIHGTVESVVDQIQELRGRMNLESLLCAPLSHETFLAITDRILPRLA